LLGDTNKEENMNHIELLEGERLELGDVVKQSFAANVDAVFEVIGVNPDYAFVCRRTPMGLDIDHECKIPIIVKRDATQTAYRPMLMETVVLH
jgi:hypothetical protein